jgi:hypothetical protein
MRVAGAINARWFPRYADNPDRAWPLKRRNGRENSLYSSTAMFVLVLRTGQAAGCETAEKYTRK